MKRLLLSLIATVALTSCSNQISTKTDVGEKYIVKDSAVTIGTRTNEDLINGLEKYLKTKQTYFGTASPRYPEGVPKRVWSVEYYVENCVRLYKGETIKSCKEKYNNTFFDTYESVVDAYYQRLEPLKENLSLLKKNSDRVIHIKKINFRPILKDLNGDKKALGYMSVDCFNPNVSIFIGTWETIDSSINVPLPESGLALDILEDKLCKKYAKFE